MTARQNAAPATLFKMPLTAKLDGSILDAAGDRVWPMRDAHDIVALANSAHEAQEEARAADDRASHMMRDAEKFRAQLAAAHEREDALAKALAHVGDLSNGAQISAAFSASGVATLALAAHAAARKDGAK